MHGLSDLTTIVTRNQYFFPISQHETDFLRMTDFVSVSVSWMVSFLVSELQHLETQIVSGKNFFTQKKESVRHGKSRQFSNRLLFHFKNHFFESHHAHPKTNWLKISRSQIPGILWDPGMSFAMTVAPGTFKL